jgi:hypothetical protein
MKRLVFIFLTLFVHLGLNSTAQVKIDGVVIDQSNHLPMPFVSIVYENTSQGTITNQLGKFHCVVDTTRSKYLKFTFIGYENKLVPVKEASPVTVYLTPALVNLPEVVVLARKRSWVIDCIEAAIKKIKKNNSDRQTRAFFSLETTCNQDEPLEVVEAFYQCMVEPRTGIINIDLKNGRFGLSPIENFYFINSNPTNILQNFKLFDKNEYALPIIPFSLNLKEMKRIFRFRLDTLENNGNSAIALISFTPKTDQQKKFSGSIFIDTTTYEIHKLVLECKHSSIFPFHPLNPSHKIIDVTMKFVITYKDIGVGKPVIDLIRFDYNMEYATTKLNYHLNSNSTMVFYDYDNSFILPYFNSTPGLSDYGKILSLPYNPIFWDRNYIIPVTQTSLDYRKYFQKHGIIVNYSDSILKQSILPRPILYWSPDIHLSWDVIGKKKPDWIKFYTGNKKETNTDDDYIKRKYFMDYQILLDFNKERDTCYWQTKSMLFLDNSFYEYDRDTIALKAFILGFEMAELYRLRLEHRLDSANQYGISLQAVTKIYDRLVSQFDGMYELYNREVKRGSDALAYETWKKRIDLRLQRELQRLRNITHPVILRKPY